MIQWDDDPKSGIQWDDAPQSGIQWDDEDSVFSKKGFLDLASSMPFALARGAQGVKQAFGDLVGNEEMAANAAANMRQIQEEQAKTKLNLGDGLGSMVYQGVKGTLEAAPALGLAAINPVLGLGAIGAATGGEAYSKYRERGASKSEAATGGLLEGGIEAGTEVLPMGFLLKNLGKTGFLNFIKGMAVREGLGEQVATLGQDAVDTAIANPNKTWQDYLAERPKAALATAIATGVQVGLTGGAGAVVRRLSPAETNAANEVSKGLDAVDSKNEELKRTQGEGTLYVGETGDVTSELPRKVTESPEQLDLARTELQNQLQREATAREEPPQGELFPKDPVTGEPTQIQENLDLQTASPEQGVASPAGEKKFSDTAYIGPKFTPKEVQTYRTANGKTQTTPEAILKWYAGKVSEDTEMSAILPKVQELVAMFEGKHGLSIELADTVKVPLDGQKVPAYYDGTTHRIYMGTQAMTGRTAVHEILHGLTHRYVEVNRESPAVKQLQTLMDLVKNEPGFKSEYGTTDIHEFISEAYSSQSFKQKLISVGVDLGGKVQNAWDAFVDIVANILGTKNVAERTALSKIFEATSDVVKAYKRDKIRTDNLYSELFKRNALPIQRERMAARMDELTQGAVSAASAANNPVKLTDPEVEKSKKIEELSGEVYIPKNPTIDDNLINKIKGEKDGSGTWNMTPGALARSELAQSTLVKTIYRLMDGAYKKAEYKINKTVKPTQETFMKILRNPTKAAVSHEILMRELKKGTDYTADELRSAGVTDDVIKAHLEFRAMMQEALEAQNTQLRDKGLPTVKALDAYISSRWSGPWRANIKDAEGNTVWQVAEHSRKEAAKAINYILAKQPNLKADDLKYRKGFEKGDNIEVGYLDMLKMLDPNDPRVAALKSVYEEYLLGTTQDVASQEKHFLSKKGVRGFAGDRKWSNTDVRDFFVQQFAYAENAFRWSEAQNSMVDVKKLLNNKELQDSQKNNIQYSKEYVKGQLGFGTNEAFEAIDNGLARMTGLSPQKLQEYMGAAKTFFYLSKLGLSVPFTITQFLQPAITTPGWHSQLDTIGYKHNPIVSTFKSIYGGAQAALWHYGQFFNSPELTKAAEKTMSKLDIEAAKYMEANGVVDINPMTDIKKGLRPTAVRIAATPFEFTIKHSEVVARSVAFMGFVSHLQQSGKYDTKTQKGRLELFQKAEDMTSLSMTDYRTQERALAFEKMGLTGDAAATLHSYQINNLMQLVKFGKEAANGNPMPLFYMVAMQGLAAGLTGLWFIDDLDDLLDNLKKIMPHHMYMRVKDISIKNLILNNTNDLVSYGLVSKITGTNIHTRMNASNQLPIWPFESKEDPIKNVVGLAPFLESNYDVGAGILKAVSPGSTQQERMAGLYQAAPTVAQGPMENLPAFSDAGVSLKTKDLSQGKIRRTEEEKNLRNYGFKSIREQKQADTEFQLSKVERELQARIQQSSNKAVESFISKDPESGVEHMIHYVELGGDPQTLVNRIPQAKIDRVTTELERRALKAGSGSRAAILKLQRYMQAVPR